jgi:hypothetical protein
MIYNCAALINTPLQPGVKARVRGEPFQRLSVKLKTVKTVCRFFSWPHLAEARC